MKALWPQVRPYMKAAVAAGKTLYEGAYMKAAVATGKLPDRIGDKLATPFLPAGCVNSDVAIYCPRQWFRTIDLMSLSQPFA